MSRSDRINFFRLRRRQDVQGRHWKIIDFPRIVACSLNRVSCLRLNEARIMRVKKEICIEYKNIYIYCIYVRTPEWDDLRAAGANKSEWHLAPPFRKSCLNLSGSLLVKHDRRERLIIVAKDTELSGWIIFAGTSWDSREKNVSRN